MKKTLTFILLVLICQAGLFSQVFKQEVSEIFTSDFSWDSLVELEKNPDKPTLQLICDLIAKTWRYEGQYLKDSFIVDTTRKVSYPYQSLELFTDSGIYTIEYDDIDTNIEKQNQVITLTIFDFENPQNFVGAKYYNVYYNNDFAEFELSTCRPTCTIGIHRDIWGIRVEGHFGGEWFRPILKLTSDTLILKDAQYAKLYTPFEYLLYRSK